MPKRRASKEVLPVVEEIKKAKEDPPSEKSTEVKPHEPAIKTSEPNALEYLQIIITGPKGCGKTSLVLAYMGQSFPPSHIEFLSKQYLHILPSNKSVMIWDLDARDEFIRYRQQSYKEADVALVCFDIKKADLSEGNTSTRDLYNLLEQWFAELDKYCPDIPIILVGLKSDSRLDTDTFFVEPDGMSVMKNLPRIKLYREVSAHWYKGSVNELFTAAIDLIDEPKAKEMYANCGFQINTERYF